MKSKKKSKEDKIEYIENFQEFLAFERDRAEEIIEKNDWNGNLDRLRNLCNLLLERDLETLLTHYK